MAEVLTSHIAACPAHPLSRALAERDALERVLEEALNPFGTGDVLEAMIDELPEPLRTRVRAMHAPSC